MKQGLRSPLYGLINPFGRTQGGGAAEDLTGLSLPVDYWVDATNGNDTNAGTSEGAAWATLKKAADTVYGVSKSGRVVVRVKADTYDAADDYFDVTSAVAASNDGLTVVFETGCVMDGTTANVSVARNGFEFSTPSAWNTIIHGNGLVIQNYIRGGSSPNGIGNRGSHHLTVYNVRSTNCDDGFSAHQTATMILYDCEADNCTKGPFVHVDTATVQNYRCKFTGRASATQGLGQVNSGTTVTFEDCIFIPDGTGQNITIPNATLTRCQLGTRTARATFVSSSGVEIIDSFVNAYADLNQSYTITRCYGLFSVRQRNGGGITMENCVFSGPATGQTAIFFQGFDPGSGSAHLIRNNIFETASAAAFMNYDTANAGYVVAAGSEFFNNILSGSAAFDADLIAADTGNTVIVDNVTADALIGAANTLDPDDYGYTVGSPAIGAATGGGNCGFGVGDVSAPARPIGRPVDADFYVDSVNGSDSNSGFWFAPYQTLSKADTETANGTRFALFRGSSWREALDILDIDNTTTTVTGSGAIPLISGADVVTSWTAEGTANVWQASVAHNGFGTERLTVYEDGVLLTGVTSTALCSSTPGSFVRREGSAGSPWTVLIHPTGSGNPTSNGKVYEVTTRRYGVFLGDNASLTGPLHTRRVISNNGSFETGLNTNVKQVLASNGTKHNHLSKSGTIEDFLCYRSDDPTASEPGQTWFTFYDNDVTGLTATMRRCGFGADRGGTRFGTGLIQHSAGSSVYTSFTGEQLWAVDGTSYAPSAYTATINGLYTKNVQGGLFGWYSDAMTLRYSQINQNGTSHTAVIGDLFGATTATAARTITIQDTVIFSVASTTQLIRSNLNLNGANLVFRNCVIYLSGFRAIWEAVSTAWSSGSLTVENCIFCYTSNTATALLVPSGITYAGNNNVFVCNTNGGTNLNLSYNGTTYDLIADWRTATGQDANSLALGPSDLASLFSGTVANGDFRLGSTGSGAAAAAISAGPQFHWDWNARAVASGPPTAWPDVPETLAEAETYVNDPAAWDFYP